MNTQDLSISTFKHDPAAALRFMIACNNIKQLREDIAKRNTTIRNVDNHTFAREPLYDSEGVVIHVFDERRSYLRYFQERRHEKYLDLRREEFIAACCVIIEE